jgi:hypothetical protein
MTWFLFSLFTLVAVGQRLRVTRKQGGQGREYRLLLHFFFFLSKSKSLS